MHYLLNKAIASSKRTPVPLRIWNQQVEIDASLLALVGPLETRTCVPVIAADGSLQNQTAFENLLGPSRPRPNAGLAWLVAYRLIAQGYDPHIQWGVRRLPAPRLTEPIFGIHWDRPLLDFVRGNTHGLIHLAPGVSRIRLLAQLFQAWPQQRFVVATGSHAEANRVRSQLFKQYQLKSSLVTPTRCPDNPRRVVVGTYTSLAHGPIECNQRDVFIAYNARHALGELAQICLMQVDSRFRLFGFLSATESLTAGEHDWLAATFGFERLVIPRHNFQAIQPRVVWIPFRGQTTVDSGLQALALKKRLVWNHAHRNRWIARLAKLLTGDSATLQKAYPAISDFLGNRTIARVVILTETTEQARRLAQRLKEWSSPANPAMEPATRTRTEQAILTCESARRYPLADQPGVTVIVWASAGRDLPPLPEEWLRVPVGRSRELLLIDLWDESQPLLQWSRQRQTAYQHAEWLAPGQNPVIERIQRFLRSRPTRGSQR
ncbi:MAG: hypothetical protein U0840_29975 [Gemmataceae bacterium]